MKRVAISCFLVGSIIALLTGLVSADVITDWNEKAVSAGDKAGLAIAQQQEPLR